MFSWGQVVVLAHSQCMYGMKFGFMRVHGGWAEGKESVNHKLGMSGRRECSGCGLTWPFAVCLFKLKIHPVWGLSGPWFCINYLGETSGVPRKVGTTYRWCTVGSWWLWRSRK